MEMQRITLEMSLKPFWNPAPENCRRICREVFRQWAPLCRHARNVSVQLWIGDGSEILDYRGALEDKFDWGRYIGCVNHPPASERLALDPEGCDLRTRARLYRDKPPDFDYAFLKQLVALIKETGRERFGVEIAVGGTFDPGPEFAVSGFKYERHREICAASFGGTRRDVVACAAILNADRRVYAGFPGGIPPGTPFGAFLGRQARHFLSDMSMDYIWFSNGFGFGNHPWGYTGTLFDGRDFFPEQADSVKNQMLDFWRRFHEECPDYPVYVRGTNMTAGIDLASDGVPLQQIYAGGFIRQPPVNSPWAAINLNLGLELTGWMSHIAELPGADFAFRFYIHDPWWLNSPWLDRYERQPYDIYLPLAIARIAGDGKVQTPSSLNFLSIDDSRGNMPEQVAQEVTPHILESWRSAPDEAGPLVWLYPFAEYHEWIKKEAGRINEVLFGDMLITAAINRGLPLNTIISTGNFIANQERDGNILSNRVIVSPVPDAGSAWETALLHHAAAGGQALVYGPLRRAGGQLRSALGIGLAEPLAGEARMQLDATLAETVNSCTPTMLFDHQAILSAGGMEETGGRRILARAVIDGAARSYAVESVCGRGRLLWLRGTPSLWYTLVPPNRIPAWPNQGSTEARYFYPEHLFIALLDRCGWRFLFHRGEALFREPVIAVSRHRGGFYYTGMNHHTGVDHELRTPFGAPVFTGCEARLAGGSACYRLPRTWRHECRIFIKQERNGHVSCRESNTRLDGVSRWLMLAGLEDAEVSVFPDPAASHRLKLLPNPSAPYVNGRYSNLQCVEDQGWCYYKTAENVSGKILIYW